ncbi:BapA/Bap/LapF family large adhesin, partial [Limoniibacter endophyticus]
GTNETLPVAATAPDTTAPEAPTGVAIAADGASITGTGEVGADVAVTDGAQTWTGTVQPDGTFSIILDPAQTDGQTLTVTLEDAAGNNSPPATATAPVLDTTAPLAPEDLVINAEGTQLTGSGEAGTTVLVTDEAGETVGSGTVLPGGTFSILISPPQVDGGVLNVTLTDVAGNISPNATVTAPIETAPDAPANLAVNAEGTVLTGTGETGTTVEVHVTSVDGDLLGTGVVQPDGTFSITISPAQANGETLVVRLLDSAGVPSLPAIVQAPDTTAPAAPGNLVLNGEGTELAGSGEPGTTVIVADLSGAQVGIGTVGEDGTFIVTLAPAQVDGNPLSVTLTDAADNISDPGQVETPDLTAPVAAENLAVAAGGISISGTGEAGASVAVTNGTQIWTGTVGPNGTFIIPLTPAQIAGQTLTVTLTDAASNVSSDATVTAPTPQTPDAPSNLSAPTGDAVNGNGVGGATVIVRDASGTIIGTDTVQNNGYFSAPIPATTDGSTLYVTQTVDGNVSPVATVRTPDFQAPGAPENLLVNEDGTGLTGTGEPGAIVRVTDETGMVLYGSGTVQPDGTFSITLSPAQNNGGNVFVTQSDASNNTSAASQATAPDTIDPLAPVITQVASQGTGLSGTGEAGASVSVTNASGAIVGTGTVQPNGTFSIIFTTPQIDGGPLTIVQKDAANNASPPAVAIAADLTPPAPPQDLAVSGDGLTLTGSGEVGATVTVRDATGTVTLGTGTVQPGGTFSIPLNAAQNNGQTLSVTLTDAAANISSPATTIAPDTTAPEAPANLAVNETGTVVSGTGEAGTTVTVSSDGTVIGTGTVQPGGQFTIVLNPPQISGQQLSVTLADGAASPNVSLPGTVAAPVVDTSAPIANNDIFSPTIDLSPVTTTVTASQSRSALINVGSFSDRFEFAVAAGTEGDATFDIGVTGLLGLLTNASAQLFVQRPDGQWELVGASGDGGLLELAGLANQGIRVTAQDLEAGNYRLVFGGGGLAGLGTTVSVNASIVQSSLTQFTAIGEQITGNVLTGTDGNPPDSLGGGTPVFQIAVSENNFVEVVDGTQVQGQYGTLTINVDGSFTYAPDNDPASVGQVDIFTYRIDGPNGTSTASIYMQIGSPDVTATWNSNDPGQPATLTGAVSDNDTALIQLVNPVTTTTVSNAISYSWLLGLLGVNIGQTSGTYNFSVASNTMTDATISINAGGLLSLLDTINFQVLRVNANNSTTVLYTRAQLAALDLVDLVGNNLVVNLQDLGPGNYRLAVQNGGVLSVAGAVNVGIEFNATDLGQLVAGPTTAATGNVLEDDVFASALSVMQIQTAPGVWTTPGANGVTVTGAHGSLQIFADGDYIYTPTAATTGIGTTDVFTYRIYNPNGSSSEATLAIAIEEGVPPVVSIQSEPVDDDIIPLAGIDALESDVSADDTEASILPELQLETASGDALEIDLAMFEQNAPAPAEEQMITLPGEALTVAPPNDEASDATPYQYLPIKPEDELELLSNNQHTV